MKFSYLVLIATIFIGCGGANETNKKLSEEIISPENYFINQVSKSKQDQFIDTSNVQSVHCKDFILLGVKDSGFYFFQKKYSDNYARVNGVSDSLVFMRNLTIIAEDFDFDGKNVEYAELVESRLKIKFYKRGEKEYKGQHNSSLDNLEDYMPVKVYESYYP